MANPWSVPDSEKSKLRDAGTAPRAGARPASSVDRPRQRSRMGVISFSKHLYCRFQDDDVQAMGAQLTYYLILSFFPFLIFIIAVLSFADLTVNDVIDRIRPVMPQLSTETIADAFEEIQSSRSGSLLSIGLLVTIWSASSGVSAIMKALNKAYDVEESRPFWKVKAYSLLFTVVLALVIVFSLVMLIFGRIIGDMLYKETRLPGNFDALWSVAQFVLPIAVMAVLFVALYRYAPNLRLRFREVLPGALFATFGWIATSLAFSFYVNNFGSYSKTYGSIGGIIVLLTWLYLSSIIIVMGGEINAVLHFDRNGKTKDNCKQFSIPVPLFFRNKK
ncbi:YihY/virulence factor BrkB family protein [Paenibacillus glycinis]|uniref:YihY family inner membrane protein n=1 Tax=Paenibacillus glycinis TaxID=2697035 RepID=A0ABW9XV99_9BACL|nr:YihY/virulence factor BrkB family protein [Paenibacillus glycinis]NBD26232.1 YihY family inner membrane protein [Paenibacillus glycinis]